MPDIMIPGVVATHRTDTDAPNPLYRLAMAIPYGVTAALIGLLVYCHVDGEPFRVSDEDGLIEWATVVAFGLCGALGVAATIANWARLSKAQKILIILVAVLGFMAVGEELSWGQRYFGFNPPEAMKSGSGAVVHMGHNDTTWHNLSFKLGPLKFSIGGMLFGVPLVLAIFFHTIFMPLRVRAQKPKSSTFVRKLGLFLPPVHLGILLLAGTILFHYRKAWKNTDAREFKELLVPTIYAFMLLHAYFRNRRPLNTIITGAAIVLLLGGFAVSVLAVL